MSAANQIDMFRTRRQLAHFDKLPPSPPPYPVECEQIRTCRQQMTCNRRPKKRRWTAEFSFLNQHHSFTSWSSLNNQHRCWRDRQEWSHTSLKDFGLISIVRKKQRQNNFLDACTRLYTLLCPSVDRSVGRSIGHTLLFLWFLFLFSPSFYIWLL